VSVLKGTLAGLLSRRIDGEHRLVYRMRGDALEIVSCYGHYDDK
jgi:toxin YoeB